MEKRWLFRGMKEKVLPRSKGLYTYFMGYLSIGFANRGVDPFIPSIDPLALLSNCSLNGASNG
ncbi:hypothetical protein [Peribacillus frigoritolerans]|uniref:hypothetical protein n=1 Tax=Peribacillus frigoritolerans TaxID=450367 RepID=UPI0019262945|nr:hypothetical protein [Peribacillus frigoritolerans]MBL3643951.1 hypothetical protein [Bacillus sp. RHFB]MEE3952476.1 hypothetical protein [Peribacillus frigoritolerans]